MSKKDKNSAAAECVKVALRCRPISESQRAQNHQTVVTIVPERGEVIVKNMKSSGEQNKVFTFDMVFQPQCAQEKIFKQSTLPIIENVLEGYNGTIFAYGQTGTGKTHTMEGDKTNPKQAGIIPRTFQHLFKSIEGTPDIQFMVWVSMLELYNEQIIDLLPQGKKEKLNIHEDPNKGVYVNDLSQQLVNSVDQMKDLLHKGSHNRHTGSTMMNKTSSRSHSIFIIKIQMMETKSQQVKRSRFNLVDLAGSQRQKKTQATDHLQRQGISINKALSVLGQVIGALSNPSSTHIPYRDSKLTRLLQDSLGGNTKTLMIANIGPSHFNYDETITTLNYAYQAKKIKNKPKINQNPKDALIRKYQEQVERLKNILQQGGPAQIKQVIKYEKRTRQGKLEDVQQKIKEQQSKLLKATEQQRKKVKQSLQNYNNQRKVLLDQLNNKQKSAKAEQQAQQELRQKYKMMKQQLLIGDQQKQKARLHQKQLIRAQQQIQQRKQAERRIEEELKNKIQEERIAIDNEGTIKQIVEKRTKKLNQILTKLKNAKQTTNQIHEFRNGQREELEEQNRELIKQLKFINLLIQNFIPISEVIELQKRLQFNEEVDDWIVQDYQGNPVPNPGSAFSYKRPLCQFVRMAVSCGDDNPRFRPDNILKLDLDLPQRTTEQFDGVQISQKVSQTINIALAQDQEQQRMIANQQQPNVYIEDPHKMNKQALLKQRQQNVRAKSAKKMRPASGRKKKV